MEEGRGKKEFQRMKPYIIYRYLMRHSDEAHTIKIAPERKDNENDTSIKTYLGSLDIYAERRSVYKDIEEMNQMLLAIDGKEGIDMAEAKELCEDPENCAIRYDAKTRGYYFHKRKYSLEDIRLLAECVYTAKFVDKDKTDKLIDILMEHVSIYEAEKIKHEAYLTDRVKTDNTKLYENIQTISDAMSKTVGGKRHTPEKIKFKYVKYNVHDVRQRVERRGGSDYTVSPLCLMINDGNYYLLSRDDASGEMRTFRVDRMRNVRFTHEPREGEEEFKKINLEEYVTEHFGMFPGEREHVVLRFIPPLLDTVVDRFGTNGVIYSNEADGKHIRAVVNVAVSDQFFGWVCGFGKRMKIVAPDTVAERFKNHLDKMRDMYE